MACFLDALAKRIHDEGIQVVGVPTSEETRERCEELGIPLTDLDRHPELIRRLFGRLRNFLEILVELIDGNLDTAHHASDGQSNGRHRFVNCLHRLTSIVDQALGLADGVL